MLLKQSFKSLKNLHFNIFYFSKYLKIIELVLPILFPNAEYYFTSHIQSIIAPFP